MMDGLSGASSVLAVITITYQLGNGVHKLLEFWNRVQDAPVMIKGIFRDLEVLSLILHECQHIETDPHLQKINVLALENCNSKVVNLQLKIEKATAGWSSQKAWRRKWADIGITLKENKIEELRCAIKKAYDILLLLQSVSNSKTIHNSSLHTREILKILRANSCPIPTLQDLTCRDSNMRIRKSFPASSVFELTPPKNLELADNDDPDSAIDTGLSAGGIVPNQTQTWHRSSVKPFRNPNSQGREKQILIHPLNLPVLKQIGLNYGLHVTAGWQYSLRLFHAVSDNASIFEFCRTGNLEAVRTLFKNREASPWDRDTLGRTPLHVAVESSQPGVVQYLLEEGADPHAEGGRRPDIPITAVVKGPGADVAPKLAILRMLQKYCGSGYDDLLLLFILGRFYIAYRPLKNIPMTLYQRSNATLLATQQILPDFDPSGPHRVRILHGAIQWYRDKEVIYYIIANIPGMLDDLKDEASCLHEAIKMRLLERDPRSMRLITQKTRHLHRIFEMNRMGSQTPTSAALLQPQLFLLWRRLLLDLKVDIPTFVDGEIAAGLLIKEGWNRASLLSIFDSQFDYEPHFGKRAWGFPVCERCGYQTLGSIMVVDLEWRRFLRSIRRRHGDVSARRIDILLEEDPSRKYLDGDTERWNGDWEWSYRFVCFDRCEDKICLSRIFDDDGPEEPLLPLYPVMSCKNKEIVGVLSEDILDAAEKSYEGQECSLRRMPGSFDQD